MESSTEGSGVYIHGINHELKPSIASLSGVPLAYPME
jgi:hypothetical protein